MNNVRSSGKFFSSAASAICMFSDLSTSHGFDETLSKPCTLLCWKQWSPSAIHTPFFVLVPAVIWPLGKQSSLICLKTNYF